MACPICGSTNRDVIAPGYYRCRGVIVIQRPDPNRGGALVSFKEPCGAAYQEADATTTHETCSCGTFAIGRCQDCSLPVCGTHSSLVQGARVCYEDAKKREAVVSAERHRQLVERLEHLGSQRREVAKFLVEMAARGNPGAKKIWYIHGSLKRRTPANWLGWELESFDYKPAYQTSIERILHATLGLATDGTWLSTWPGHARYRPTMASPARESGGWISGGGGDDEWRITLAHALSKVRVAADRYGVCMN